MSPRVAAAYLAVGAFSAAWAFVVYGDGRTMAESVGFSLGVSAGALLMLAIVALPVLVGLGVAAWLLVPGGLSRAVYAAIAAGVLLGSGASEVAILADEAQFAAEVERDPSTNHARDRSWPNRGASLVYVVGRGTHATD